MNALQSTTNNDYVTLLAFDKQVKLTIDQARYIAKIDRNEFDKIDTVLIAIGLREHAFEHTASSAMRDLYENKFCLAHDKLDILTTTGVTDDCTSSTSLLIAELSAEIASYSDKLSSFAATSVSHWRSIEVLITACKLAIDRYDEKKGKSDARLKLRSGNHPVVFGVLENKISW
jgi:hypothetical protein